MDEFHFLLEDRKAKIKSMYEAHDLERTSYISFSGGKDSAVLSKLVDLAVPGNKIPRVFINTGIEFKATVDFAKAQAAKDPRIEIFNPGVNISEMLKKHGYPFVSKEHSQKIAVYQRSGKTKSIEKYTDGSKGTFGCPKKWLYNFTPEFNIKCSDKCCFYLKKKPIKEWMEAHAKTVTITGMRADEGGARKSHKGCAVFSDEDASVLTKFHPLMPLKDSFIDWFVEEFKVELSPLYGPPYYMKRTGCKGCPFSHWLQDDLTMMGMYFPGERKQCEALWKPVYEEYRRVGRLPKIPSLFD